MDKFKNNLKRIEYSNYDKEPWWKKAVVYQIYVRSFFDSTGNGTGDLKGIEEKLPYLKDLGIDAVYLNPINESPNEDNGYDVSDFKKIMEDFGTEEDFKSLIESAGNLGIKIIMDIVPNHTSSQHIWFKEGRKDKKNKYHDYYIFADGKGKNPPNNWLSFFSGSAWTYNEPTGEYYLHIFSPEQPDLNYRNEEVRRQMAGILKYWKDFGIGGVRLDAVNHLAKDVDLRDADLNPDGSPDFIKRIQNLPDCHEYIRQLREEVYSDDFLFAGEAGGISFEESYLFTAPSRKELDLLFHFDFHSPGIDYETMKETDIDIPEKFKKPFFGWSSLTKKEGWNPVFWSNHDTTRTLSRLIKNDNLYGAKMLALLQMTMRGTPFIYYGDEIGMTNPDFKTIEDYRDVGAKRGYEEEVLKGNKDLKEYLEKLKITSRDNGRTPMQWNNRKNAGFTTGTPWIAFNENYNEVNAENESEKEGSILNFYKKAIALRKANPVLISGETEEYFHDHPNLVVYKRFGQDSSYFIIANYSQNETRISKDEINALRELCPPSSELLLSNYKTPAPSLKEEVTLRPYEAMIFKAGKFETAEQQV